MNERLWNRSLVLTAIGVAVVSTASVWLAWSNSDSVVRFSIIAFLPVLAAALLSYSLRNVRFFYFLLHSGIAISLRSTVVVQAIGFALSVTPGHVGEVFKLHLIRERTGTPIVQSAPLLLLDRVTEGGGFLVLAILSALTLPGLGDRIQTPVLMVLSLAILCAFALTRNRWRGLLATPHPRLMASPLWQRFVPHLRNLWLGLETSFSLTQILGGLALSVLARFADGWVVLFTAHMLGMELTLPAAVFVLAMSGLAGGVSLLPAGVGAVETTMIGLLVLQGASWSNALVITLFARLATLWLWVALGLMLAFWLHRPAGWLPLREGREI